MEEKELLQLLQRDPDAGFAQFLAQYGALVKGILRRMMPTAPQDVEECAADLLIILWKHAANLQAKQTPLRPWVIVSTRNLGISALRKKAKRGETLHETAEQTHHAIAEASYLQETPKEEKLQALVAAMSQPDRSIFQRKYWLMQSSKEIAAALGLEVQTVNTRLFRGRKLLKQALEQGLDAEDFAQSAKTRGTKPAQAKTASPNFPNKKTECAT
ncbi:MAG: sigma-70 family RNA polymerase sigma factor [Faecalibacterium sp.]